MFKHKVIATILLASLAGNVAAHDAPRVYINDLDLGKLEIQAPTGDFSVRSRTFELTDKERSGMIEMYKEAVEKVVDGNADYEIVASAEDADVVIEAELLKLNPIAPKDDARSRGVMEQYFTEGAGSATIRFEISDNEDLSIVFESTRDAGRFWGENDRFSNTQELKRLFKTWGSHLVKKLDKIEA
jgi:hypothetical protein